jgi:formylglycine-generating enzyme required for sulfatase activity
MGCIYRVWDNTLREVVALKTLLPQFFKDRQIIERFLNEAKITRQLSHPNIVRVHDIGMDQNVLYISMEYVRGRSLRALLDEQGPGQRLPVMESLRIINSLCEALQYAHRYTVHRDIKPENVMITEDGTVKLMDFGISKLKADTRLTGTSMVMGTPFYMAPEQLRNSRDVDGRADIYSVGVVLYEMLTGNMPTGVPKPASQLTRDVPPSIDPIIAKCVEQDPAKRYESPHDLQQAIVPLMGRLERGLKEDNEAVAGARRARHLWRRGAGVLLAVVVVAAGGLGLQAAEVRRQALLAAPRTAVAAPEGDAWTQARFEPLIERAKSRVEPLARENARLQPVLEQGDALWKMAQAEFSTGRMARGHDMAAQALQCFAGPVLCPEGMVFVPPGEVRLYEGSSSRTDVAEAFFIDQSEVTNRQFSAFCSAESWPEPSGLATANPDAPVGSVRWFDARAYAAWAGKKLPTETQWARAAYGAPAASATYPWGEEWGGQNCAAGRAAAAPVAAYEEDVTPFGVYDMACNVSEWTRTPYQPLDAADAPPVVAFRTPMVVRGGNYTESVPTPLFQRLTWPYESSLATVGFRCVREMPLDPAEIDALL